VSSIKKGYLENMYQRKTFLIFGKRNGTKTSSLFNVFIDIKYVKKKNIHRQEEEEEAVAAPTPH
jgi:hypothetical protein